jgi:hypothetical protein
MIAIAPYKGAATVMVDRDWLALWAGKFPDPALAQDLLNDEHLSDRIAQIILKRFNGHAGLANPPVDQDAADLKSLLGLRRDALLRLLGLLWQAPVLAPVLPDANVRNKYRVTHRAELDLALRYRSQTPADVVGPLDARPSFSEDGLACVLAWFEHFDAPLRDRLVLLFPRREEEVGSGVERAMLVSRALQDKSVLEVLTS